MNAALHLSVAETVIEFSVGRDYFPGMSAVLNVEQMSLEEKLLAMETLWENLSRSEADVPVPQWHKDLLDERERAIKEGKAQFLDWETAKARIASGTK